MFFRYFHTLAGFGIATDAGRTMVQIEAAETADFDALTSGKRSSHGVNQDFYAVLYVFCQKMRAVFGGKHFCQTNH
ncbi:Uncharacterised protein [Neisseria meningitidis]|nr:hypothetical protein NM2001068_2153 [Neisseria meningitidis 2001068]EQD23573.1 hypothetical protein NM3173_2178 [Neisseria meningitidis NM3173]CWP31271.1 Uncharacterised protein [Neisseria meningitidis]EOC41832.1 hypothetical protein NM2001068_2190 [Neisseria meningitidis 2001068]CWP87507.1 Uncharacterised protein [Neisseria meningitidis]